MLVDGRALAEEIYAEIKQAVADRDVAPHLTIITCQPNKATQQYLALKKRKAAEAGVGVNIIELPDSLSTEEVVQVVTQAQLQTDGIIVQLPLPKHLDTQEIINAIPVRYDVDGLHYDGTPATMMSPVVGAIEYVAKKHDLLLATQQVVVVGNGRLVGQPATVWAQKQGANVTVITKDTSEAEAEAVVAHADALILGAGQAGLVRPDMVKEGVVIFDAGTSEDGGELKGDADPAIAEKASLMTPVPGGIGPLTVACLLKNVVTATR
jgi:methylenetetrahydrofolate dehydrogenase (NADP+)/methenyltetrahydrofolate cyclohydrolase